MNIYTPLEQAKEEIQKRWNNTALSREVAAYLGDIPEPFSNEPRSVLFRNIMTPDNEYSRFLELANAANLKPLGLEYLNDQFCTRNGDKVGLGRLTFLNGRSGNEKFAFHYTRIIDLVMSDKMKFAEIKTLWGESLVDFHHRMLPIGSSCIEIEDVSSWHGFSGHKAAEYYPYFLALFVCHGILFENFVKSAEEGNFRRKVVEPAYEKIKKHFGLEPLIVPLYPDHEAANVHWWCYPECIEKEIGKYGN